MNWLQHAISIGYKCEYGKSDIQSNWYGLHKYYMPNRKFVKGNKQIIMSIQSEYTRHPILKSNFPDNTTFDKRMKVFTDKQEYEEVNVLFKNMAILYIAIKEGDNYNYESFANVPPPIELL